MTKLMRKHMINRVFTRDVDQLRRILIGMGMAVDEGEDILQDVYQEALVRPPKDRGQASLRHWFRRVTVNRALLQFRRKRVQQRAIGAMSKAQRSEAPEPLKQVLLTLGVIALIGPNRNDDNSVASLDNPADLEIAIETRAVASQLLAVADLFAQHPEGRDYAAQKYAYIIDNYQSERETAQARLQALFQ